MLPDKLQTSVEMMLTAKSGFPGLIIESREIVGGCINEAYALKTKAGRYFVKYNFASEFPGMFEKEAEGLKILADTHTILVPGVVGAGCTDEFAFLLLQYIESETPGRDFWNEFGTQLADLHLNTNEYFGLDHDNYIGSLVQKNTQTNEFISFFISQRLEPQLKDAYNKGAFSHSDLLYFDSLFNSLNQIFPPEKPALVHGDIWSGNFLVSADGSPCIIDPAVYYGHREADIAMTKLFGGFPQEFYHAYNEVWPMEKDWQKRIDIFNLYPLLVHVNLFGGGYARQVMQIIRQF